MSFWNLTFQNKLTNPLKILDLLTFLNLTECKILMLVVETGFYLEYIYIFFSKVIDLCWNPCFFLLFFFFWPCCSVCGILVLQPGIEPKTWQWAHWVPTSGPWGNSQPGFLRWFFFSSKCAFSCSCSKRPIFSFFFFHLSFYSDIVKMNFRCFVRETL